jgi:hypothetical protein
MRALRGNEVRRKVAEEVTIMSKKIKVRKNSNYLGTLLG